MIRRATGNHHVMIWLLFLLAFALRAYGLSDQPALEDEVAAAYSASGFMQHGLWSLIMWEHPPLRNVLIYLGGQVFGEYSAWGLRAGSVLLGSLSVPLLGYLADSLFTQRRIAYLAAFFLAIDPLAIALSRQAVQESMTVFFILAGVLTAYLGFKKSRFLLHCAAGASFGLAAASKWHGLFPWAVCALTYLAGLSPRDGSPQVEGPVSRSLSAAAAYLAVPVTVYAAVHLPWLLAGHTIGDLMLLQIHLLKSNYAHVASAYAETYLVRRAWLWFLVPSAWSDFVFSGGKAYLTIAMGNFLAWVLTLPSLVLAVRTWIRSRSFSIGFIIGLFCLSYFPLVFTARSMFAFNAFSIIPFAFLLSAWAADQVVLSRQRKQRLALAYLVLMVLLSALLYPMAIARTLEHAYLQPLARMYSPHGEQQ